MNSASYEVQEVFSGQRFHCAEGQSVLQAMEQQGKRCVPVGCRGGGCGLCKVRVLSGSYQRGQMSCKHVPDEAASQGIALACQVFPRSDLNIECLRRTGVGDHNNKNQQEVSS